MIPMIDPNTGGSGRPPGYLQPHQGEVAAENIMSLLRTIYDKNDDRIYHLVVKDGLDHDFPGLTLLRTAASSSTLSAGQTKYAISIFFGVFPKGTQK